MPIPTLDAATRQQMRAEAEPLLTPRQFQIFCLRYGLDGEPPQKLTTIATRLGLSVDTVEGHLQSARIRFARWYEPVPPRERVRRDLLLGQSISEDFLAFHAQIDAEQLYAAQPDLAVATLTGALPPESIYALLPPLLRVRFVATLQAAYQAQREGTARWAADPPPSFTEETVLRA
ncbi:MAG: hypothetical protein H0X24_18565 [Ktedonobacterales bacterium]|nr:hypothetical protein [Ktedonobacterales bacterium]